MTAIQSLIEKLEAFANDSSSKRSSNQTAEAAQQVAEELTALQAIYGEESIGLLTVQKTQSGGITTVLADESAESHANYEMLGWEPTQPIRLAFIIPLDVSNSPSDSEESITIRLSATLPSGYPLADASPQLQLLSRYIGPHGVDHQLFGRILRIFIQTTSQITESQHVRFEKGQVALFDGIEKARELIESWYSERQADKPPHELQTYDQDQEKNLHNNDDEDDISEQIQQLSFDNSDRARKTSTAVKLVTSQAISERKSTFVGHAAALYDPADVPVILANLLQDRRIARASHPTMYAWVCKVKDENGSGKKVKLIHRDCDDDGETAAGGRLAHLLDLCHVENGIVIVTRWYGGVHLGADRFKLINRAARDALELAELVDGPLNPSKSNNSKGRKDH